MKKDLLTSQGHPRLTGNHQNLQSAAQILALSLPQEPAPLTLDLGHPISRNMRSKCPLLSPLRHSKYRDWYRPGFLGDRGQCLTLCRWKISGTFIILSSLPRVCLHCLPLFLECPLSPTSCLHLLDSPQECLAFRHT